MKLFTKLLFLSLILLTVSTSLKAQVYLGGGRVISVFGPSGLDENKGFGAIIQRQVYLKDRKFSLTPTLQGALLTSRKEVFVGPEFYSSVSFGTHLNFDLVSTNKFRIAPFVGPSLIWISGLRAEGGSFPTNSIDIYKLGLEGGLSLSYIHSEKFSMKLIPLTFTRATKDFRQGNILSLLFQIM